MNLLSYLIATVTVLILGFGLYILRLNPRLKLYRLFFLLCTATFLAAFSVNMMYSAKNKDIILLWDKMGIIGCVLSTAITLHFFILLTDKKLKNWQACILYVPALIILFLHYISYPLYSDFIRYGNLWKYIPANNFTYYFFIIYSIAYSCISILLLFLRTIQAKLQKEKLQSKIILITALILSPVFITTDLILPQFDFFKFLPMAPFGRVIYIIIIWYALIRYRFLIVQPSIVADEIISHIDDMVLVLTPEFKIITANNTCQKLLFKGNNDYIGRDLFEFAQKDDEFIPKMANIINGEMNNCNCRLNYKSSNELIITDTYASRIVDKFDDLIGILIISKENRKLKQLQKLYSLSDRQIEVIVSCLAGLSNDDISRKLGISKKTTEAHFCNIYNKLGINNRIKLFNIIKDFQII